MSTKKFAHLGVSIVAVVIVLVVFTSPLGPLPPLGNFLNPTSSNSIYGVGLTANNPPNETLNLPQLKGTVYIYRDQQDIPHVYAQYDSDMFFAVGYLQAQDRLFQLDIQRRLFSGNLSEVLGNVTLENDMFFQSLGLERSAAEVYNAMKVEAQNGNTTSQRLIQATDSYTAGINEYISENHPLPFEFQLLGYKPTPWNSVDSIAFAKYMSFSLGFENLDLKFAQIVNQLGSAEAYQLFPENGSYQIPVTPGYGGYPMPGLYNFTSNGSPNGPVPASYTNQVISAQVASASQNVDKVLDNVYTNFGSLIDQFKGSNNWVINGSKSATGHPILANDMHLQWSTPSIWYQMDYHSLSLDNGNPINVWGFIFIGSPFIVAGHNEHVAWGFTNVGGDVLDWYYYKTQGNQYWYNGQWVTFNQTQIDIKVKGQPDFKYTTNATVEGPIIPGADYSFNGLALAASWIGIKSYEEMGYKAVFKAIYEFGLAQNYTQFRKAVYLWDGPAQNIVYADYNNIAIWVAGEIPIRSANVALNLGNGRLPINGSLPNTNWIGYVPPQDWPTAYNPSQEYLASDNQKSAGPNYQYYIGSYYDPGYRARRSNYLLHSNTNIDITKMEQIQTDVLDTSAQAFVPFLLNAINTIGANYANKPASWNSAVTILQNWNYYMLANESAPLIYEFFINNYLPYTFKDEYVNAGLDPNSVPYPQLNFLENLTANDINSHWFNNGTTVENGNQIMLKAFSDALTSIQNLNYGNDASQWVYGNWHKASFASLTGLQALSPPILPSNGSGYTLNPAGGQIANHGPSERAIYDLSNLSNSVAALPGGQSGNPASPHYHDLLDNYFLTWKYYTQLFFPDRTNFPTSQIESTLILRRSG